MAEKYSKKNDPHFDLDSYLREKAEEGPHENENQTGPEEPKSSFIRNSIILAVFVVLSFFWYHDWNISQALAVFADEQPNEQIAKITENPSGEVITSNSALSENELAELQRIDELRQLESLENLEGMEALEQLEELEALESLEELEKLENIEIDLSGLEELQKMGIRMAIEGLRQARTEQIQQDGEINEFAQFGIFSALKALEELEKMDFQEFSSSSLQEYRSGLDAAGLSHHFNEEELQILYEAKVSVNFLKILNDTDILDQLDIPAIIELSDGE